MRDPFLAHRNRVEVLHELRQVLEVAPEAIDVADRLVDRHRLLDVDAARTAELMTRVGATVRDDSGAALAPRFRRVDAERLIHIAVSGRTAVEQCRTGDRGN